MTELTQKLAHRCEVASRLAEAEWVEVPELECLTISEGGLQALGRGSFVLRFGLLGQAGALTQVPHQDLLGRYVRVLLEDLLETVLWYGVIDQEELRPEYRASEPRGESQLRAVHVLGLLDRYFPVRAIHDGADEEQTLGGFPPFNEMPTGDMAATDDPVLGVRLWDRSGNGQPWTAYHALRSTLKLAASDFRVGWGTILSGPLWQIEPDHLDFVLPTTAAHGKSVAELANLLAHPSRGLTLRCHSVADDTITLEAVPCGLTEVIIGDTTLAPATPTALVLDGDARVAEPRLSLLPPAYEVVYAFGDRPLHGLTLWYEHDEDDPPAPSLIPDGWSPDDQPPLGGTDERIWRRWKLNPAWDGLSYGSPIGGLALRLEGEDTLPDGLLEWYDAPVGAPAELTLETPAGLGWTDSPIGPRQPAAVFIGSDARGWRQLSLRLAVQGQTLTLGSDRKDAWLLRSLLRGGESRLLVTCGVRGLAALCCAALPGPCARERPTVLSLDRKDCGYWILHSGAVLGVSAGALVTQTNPSIVRDDVERLQHFCAAAAQTLCAPRGAVTWRLHGVMDPDLHPPGEVLDPVRAGGQDHALGAILAQRTWHFGRDYGMSFDAAPRPPGLRVSG